MITDNYVTIYLIGSAYVAWFIFAVAVVLFSEKIAEEYVKSIIVIQIFAVFVGLTLNYESTKNFIVDSIPFIITYIGCLIFYAIDNREVK